MTLLSRDTKEHIGKVVSAVYADDMVRTTSLSMCSGVVINFTDGTSIKLGLDWRGDECYISEIADIKPSAFLCEGFGRVRSV